LLANKLLFSAVFFYLCRPLSCYGPTRTDSGFSFALNDFFLADAALGIDTMIDRAPRGYEKSPVVVSQGSKSIVSFFFLLEDQ
jgi:hypothetical protein